ncbi:DnaB-like helicase C-terminal domain-containing protein [Methanohalobium sp.]|uniref:DnaB-like helicase C-terminal domain-containing protein n=1 Tax=Methanohalobium sp. TaxID=2837493 RepID=UPI0025EBF441|nr:DnaB-like helicase C-terminal domain-containing protein [Methanohalobium sp.]
MRTEEIVLKHLFHNEDYARKVLPFLKAEYFHDASEKLLFKHYSEFFAKYNDLPSFEAIENTIENDNELTEGEYEDTKKAIENTRKEPEKAAQDWLLDTTENFCQDKAVYNAIMDSIQIYDGKDKKRDKGSIPDLLSNALAVTFDDHIGHNYFNDAEDRFEFYRKQEDKVPFDIDYLNRITKGGVSRKSLTILMAGTGVGKSLAMAHFAASNLMDGKNVLYITAELSEEAVTQRIDANLLDCEMDDIPKLQKKVFEKKVNTLRNKTQGELVVKEYPTASANVNHVRYCLNELRLKKNFVPDVVYVDYLNIMTSSRIKAGTNVNTNTYVKAIAEEFRGLGVEKNVPIVTATQFNRGGMTNSDPGLEDTSESIGVTYTADAVFAMVQSEEHIKLNQIMFKQLKNRWGDITRPRKFVVGVNKAKMRLYDVEESAQNEVSNEEDKSVMDNSKFSEGMNAEKKDKVAGFKF